MRHAVVVLLVIFGCVAPASADWRSLKSEHFLVIGDATDRDLRDVALRLEQFRDVVSRRVPAAVRGDTPPVVVLVFRSMRGFEPFMPRADGRTIRVAGFFQPGQGVHYIAMTTEDADDAMPTILHEFAHVLLRGAARDTPLWFQEGLAEYYSTFEVVQGGRRANIGKPIAHHIQLLRERRLPFSRFFSVDRTAPEYTKDTVDRAVLYAQAWAIVHHAYHGESNRQNQLFAFVDRLARGDDTASAFRESYGTDVDTLEREVQLYVQRQAYGYTYIDFDARVPTQVNAAIAPVSDAEADAWLGDLLTHMGRTQDATARLERALDVDPNLALAHASLGTVRLIENDSAAARGHLEKAVALGSTNEFAHVAYAYAVLSGGAAGSDQAADAARALQRALELRPGYTEATLLLGHAYLLLNRYAEVRDLLAPVVKADPTNHLAALRLAEAFLGLNDFAAARPLLGPVLARSTDAAERDRARELLGVSAGMQQRRDTLAAAGVAAPPPNTSSRAGGASPAPPSVARLIPDLRALGPNEQRTYGLLEAIECSQAGIVVILRTADAAVRARAARFEDIEFRAYRPLPSMKVDCGKQEPRHEVYLTWRAGATPGADRTAVAVEVLPEGFVP